MNLDNSIKQTAYICNVNQNQSNSKYSTEEKKNIARKIKELNNEEQWTQIFKIIRKETKYTVNGNGVFLMFHLINDKTLDKVVSYLNKISKKNKKSTSENTSDTNSLSTVEMISGKLKYKPYSVDEFNESINQNNKNMGPKLSNHEKSVIRRARNKSSEGNDGSSEYCDFDVSILTETSPKNK
jgi:hypothetical protein